MVTGDLKLAIHLPAEADEWKSLPKNYNTTDSIARFQNKR
jgi:hypothetical protein